VRRRFRHEPPVADRTLVERKRLLERLRGRWRAPVTVLSAPAGYGKTTLLAQAVAANAAAPVGIDCWLTCEPDDESASSLAEGLLQALAAALHPVDPVDPPGSGATGATGDAGPIAEAMWWRSPTQVALIVDDVHEIAPGSPAARLLARVVQQLPANGHVVLAGRGPPPLPLARLELAGHLVRLDEHDLAFTADEQERFASAREVPADRLATCGGWPALAELNATAGPGATADYVGQEVLAGAPARRRRLALLAHLGTVDAEVAHAALGEEVDLDELLAGLPLVATAGDGTRTLHGLWRSLLARDATAVEVAGARRRAGRVLRHQGQAVAAIRLLIDAAAWDELGEAIVDVLGAAHPPVPRDVLARWYERLPAAARADPGGRLLAAVATGDTDPVSAVRDLDAAAAGFRDRDSPAGELACLVQLGQLAWWSEDRARLVAVVARVFELERSGCDGALPLACLGRALVADVQNDSRTVLAELDRIPPGSLNDRWQAIVDWLRSTSSMHLGDARTALTAADDALAHAGHLHQPLAEGARLQARWFLGEVDAVADALPALVERTFASGPRNFAAIYASQCCLVDASTGRPERAAEQLARARTAAGTSPAPLVDSHLSLAAAAVAVATGDDDRAATILTDYLARHPLAAGHSAAPQQRNLALIYVLASTTRPTWDAADLGPVFAVARDLARALAAVREGAGLPADTPRLPDTGIVRAHVPRRWATELAVAAVAAGHPDGWRLLEDLWPEARPDVVALAQHGPDDTNGRARHTGGVTSHAAARPARPPGGPAVVAPGVAPAGDHGAVARRRARHGAGVAARARAVPARLPRAARHGEPRPGGRRSVALPRRRRPVPQPAGHPHVPVAGARTRAGTPGPLVLRAPGRQPVATAPRRPPRRRRVALRRPRRPGTRRRPARSAVRGPGRRAGRRRAVAVRSHGTGRRALGGTSGGAPAAACRRPRHPGG
jgi:hypothetical protein